MTNDPAMRAHAARLVLATVCGDADAARIVLDDLCLNCVRQVAEILASRIADGLAAEYGGPGAEQVAAQLAEAWIDAANRKATP